MWEEDSFCLSEIVVHDALRLHAKAVEISSHGLDEHWWAAEVVLAILRRVVDCQIRVANAIESEAGIVFHAKKKKKSNQ